MLWYGTQKPANSTDLLTYSQGISWSNRNINFTTRKVIAEAHSHWITTTNYLLIFSQTAIKFSSLSIFTTDLSSALGEKVNATNASSPGIDGISVVSRAVSEPPIAFRLTLPATNIRDDVFTALAPPLSSSFTATELTDSRSILTDLKSKNNVSMW